MALAVRNTIKPSKGAIVLAKSLNSKGVQIQRLPPIDVQNELTYARLSNFLDAVIADIARVCPDIFDVTSGNFTKPGQLKAYLYAVCMHHFQRAGILITAGGAMPPTCAGAYVPNALLAWLQYIGVYSEGDTVGKARYQQPSTIPVVGDDCIIAGTAAETSLATSGYGMVQGYYQVKNSQCDFEGVATAANATTYIANWNTNGEAISDLFRQGNYPCSAMWDEVPTVPDGSYFSFPTVNCTEAPNSAHVMFTNPFTRWNEEIGALYYSLSGGVVTTTAQPFTMATRCGPMASEWPLTGILADGFEDQYFARKLMFCFILRGVDYRPGMPTKEMRVYYGDKLRSFRIVPVIIDLAGYHEVLARAIMQVKVNGATYDKSQNWAALVIHEHAVLRKYFLHSIGFNGEKTTAWRTYIPTAADQLMVLAPMAQIINDLGAVVRGKMLHIPLLRAQTVALNVKWYTLWNAFGTNGLMANPWNSAMISATNTTQFSWSINGQTAQAISATWVTNNEALAQPLFASWGCVYQLNTLFVKYISNGVAYGKADLLYPVGKGPRGGISMLVKVVRGPISDDVYWVDAEGGAIAITMKYRNLIGLVSVSPIVGPEIAVAAIERWPYGEAGTVSTSKYGRRWAQEGDSTIVDRFITETMNPGGTFLDHLSEAMEMRHGMNDVVEGIVTSNDNVDACIWDAMKGILGTIAGAIQPAAGKAAALGCGMIPLVGPWVAPACDMGAQALVGFVKDYAETSTNRKAAATPKEEENKLKRAVAKAKAVEAGELPEQRPKGMDGASGKPVRQRDSKGRFVSSKAPAAKRKPKPKPRARAPPKKK